MAMIRFAAALGCAFLAMVAQARAEGKLNIYCTANEEWCQVMANEFAKKTGVEVSYTRKGTGETYAQIKAEASNPKGDIWWGGTGDPHLQAAEEKLTLVYESPQLKNLHPWAQAQWKLAGGRTVGIYLGMIGFVYNKEVIDKKKLPIPKCWADLLKPDYKGEIQMSNPHSSGTAYTVLATLVQMLGEDKAFDYLKKLDLNINQYTKQGPAPGMAAARGETAIAITFMHDGSTNAKRGFPVVTVAPCEGTGYEIGSMSIVEGARNLDNAKKFYEFALSVAGQETAEVGESFQSPSNKDAAISKYAPRVADVKLIEYDFKKYGSSEERKRLLQKWDNEIKALAR